MAPTRKRRRLRSELALKTSLESGLYLNLLVHKGQQKIMTPKVTLP